MNETKNRRGRPSKLSPKEKHELRCYREAGVSTCTAIVPAGQIITVIVQ